MIFHVAANADREEIIKTNTIVNPYMPSELFYPYHFKECICQLRNARRESIILFVDFSI